MERARESREAREKSYEDYHWANLCEDAAKLKKLRVPELNKYLKYHGLLKQHQKSSKNDKVKTIMGPSLQMNTLRTDQAEVGGRNESGQLDSSGESARVMPLTLKTTQMISFLLLSPQTRDMETSSQLQHAQDERQQEELKLTSHSFK